MNAATNGRITGRHGCFCLQKSKIESTRLVWLDALPALQVAYLRAFFGCVDSNLRFGDDRAFAFHADTVGKSDLWHLLVAFECLVDTDAGEGHGSGKC